MSWQSFVVQPISESTLPQTPTHNHLRLRVHLLYCLYFDVHLQEICYLYQVVSRCDDVTHLFPLAFVNTLISILNSSKRPEVLQALKQLQKRLAAGSTAHAVALKDAIDGALVIK